MDRLKRISEIFRFRTDILEKPVSAYANTTFFIEYLRENSKVHETVLAKKMFSKILWHCPLITNSTVITLIVGLVKISPLD